MDSKQLCLESQTEDKLTILKVSLSFFFEKYCYFKEISKISSLTC